MPYGSKNQAKKIALGVSHDCIASRARLLNRVVSRIYDQALKSSGIKVSQFGLLGAIELFGPIQPGKLGELLELEKSTVSRNVRLMADRNWIRVKETEDGREQFLELTQLGRTLFVAAAPAWQAAQKEVMKLFGPDTGTVLGQLLERAQAGE